MRSFLRFLAALALASLFAGPAAATCSGVFLPGAACANFGGGSAIPGPFVLGTNVPAWLLTPTSANLAAAVPDETGTGPLVFANGPAIDLTNATNLPSPGPSTRGGVESIATAAHNFVTGISTLGVPSLGQPAVADISDWGTGVASLLGQPPNATGGLVGYGGAMGNVTGHASLDVPLTGGSVLPNLSASVESTGIPGLDQGNWFIYTPTAFSATAGLRVDRSIQSGSGTPASAYNAIWGNCTSGSANAGFEWCILGQMNNNTPTTLNSQNIALASTISKNTPTNTTPTTGSSGTGATATVTFSGGATIPTGHSVKIVGMTPSGYNGTYVVTASSAGSVSFASATTGSQSVAGTIVDTSVSPSWSLYGNCIDNTTENNPISSCIGLELDVSPQSATTDTNHQRVELQLSTQGVSGSHVSYGIFVTPAANNIMDYILYASGAGGTFFNGVDLSAASFSGNPFKSNGFAVDGVGDVTMGGNLNVASTVFMTGLPTSNPGGTVSAICFGATAKELWTDTSATACGISSIVFKTDITAFTSRGAERLEDVVPPGDERHLASGLVSIDALAEVDALAPVRFAMIDKSAAPANNSGLQYGLTAEDVCAADDALCARNPDGSPSSYNIKSVLGLTIAAVQEMKVANDTLRSRVYELERRASMR